MFTIEQENTGLIFENQSDSPKAPSYKGMINVNGEQFEVALWDKEFEKGGNGFTVKIQEPYQKDEEEAAPRKSAPTTSRPSSSPARGRGITPRPKPQR